MVADQFREYIDAGVTHFIMHGWPYLEEAQIFGREVLPLLKDVEPVILPNLERTNKYAYACFTR